MLLTRFWNGATINSQGFTDAATYLNYLDLHKFPLFSTSGSVTQFD